MDKTARCGQARSCHAFAMFSLLIVIVAAGCGNDYEQVHGNAEEGFSAPLLKSPVDGEEIDVSNPMLVWFAVPNAVSFHVEISGNEDFENLEDEVQEVPATSFMISDFTMKEGKHFWRVRARNAFNDWTEWSSVGSFTVVSKDVSKGADRLITHPSGDVTVFVHGKVDFEAGPPGDPAEYRCAWDFGELGTHRGTAGPESQVFDRTGSYAVRFTATDSRGGGSMDEVNVWVVDGTPTLLLPADGYSTEDDFVDFSWSAVQGASSYVLFIPPNGTAPGRSIPVTGTSRREPGFEPGSYLWWVYAKDSQGNLSTCPQPRAFTIREAPAGDEEHEGLVHMMVSMLLDAFVPDRAKARMGSRAATSP
jgi:hypothetical protein